MPVKFWRIVKFWRLLKMLAYFDDRVEESAPEPAPVEDHHDYGGSAGSGRDDYRSDRDDEE